MRRHGYTLIELIVTVTILGLLASASVHYYGAAVERERWDAARDILFAIYTGEQMYISLNGGASLPGYYPYPPQPGTTTLSNCPASGAGRTTCMNNWRANVYTDDPSDALVNFIITTTGDPAPSRLQHFRAIARRTIGIGNVPCMTVDETRTVSTSPSPLPAGCTAGWPRP